MSCFLLVNVEITDPVRYAEYVQAVAPTIREFGGRYLVRGGKAEALEGSYQPKRVVVLQFDSVERAKAWWSSAAYAGPKAIRQAAARTDMILVEGIEGC